jgi:hypothetical protein
LTLRILDILDCGVLVEIALVIQIQLTKSVLQRKYFVLWKLRILPVHSGVRQGRVSKRGSLPLEFENVHGGGGDDDDEGARGRR